MNNLIQKSDEAETNGFLKRVSENQRDNSELLREELFRLAAIVESSDDAIFSKTFDGTILSWNRGAEKTFGYAAAEVLGKNISLIFPREQHEEETRIIEKIKRGEPIAPFETLRKGKDGADIPVSLTVSPIKNIGGEIIGVSKIARNITARKQAAEALRQSEERYRAFIEQSSEGIWRFEITEPFSVELPVEEQIEQIYHKTYLAECNNATARQYGYQIPEDLLGKRIDEFWVRGNFANESLLREFIKASYKLTDAETVETDKEGKSKYFLNNLIGIIENERLVRIWGMKRDITVSKQTEQAYLDSEKERRQSQKVEAIGRLAGGIAHDFNNFLAVIMLHVDMLNRQLPADSPGLYRIDEIKQVTTSAAEMVKQLLAFSRKQPMQPRPVVINQIVTEVIKILRPLIGEDIEVKLDLEDALGVCFVDPNQITQVLMNLAVNAKDAMPGGGVINIKTSNINLSKQTVNHKAQAQGDYIQLTVSDNGGGIDATIHERIFEPFFTTKEMGKGSGLGLSTVYGIVKQSNGFIWVSSETGRGASFEIQFPRIDQAQETVETENDISIPRGTETILLVEDEEQIRRVVVEVLNTLGYQVFEAGNGTQAVQLAELFKDRIDLLLTDVVMPRMNGKDLAAKVKALHQETAVLFMSGYTDDIIENHGVLEGTVHFLSKPFSHQALAIKVREAIDS